MGLKSAESNSFEEIKIEILHRSIGSSSNDTPFKNSSDIGANQEASRQFQSLNEPQGSPTHASNQIQSFDYASRRSRQKQEYFVVDLSTSSVKEWEGKPPQDIQKICHPFYLQNSSSIIFCDESASGTEFKPTYMGMKVKDIAVTQEHILIVNDKGEVHYQELSKYIGIKNLQRQQSSISQMFISAIAACKSKILYLTSSGFVYQSTSLTEDPIVIFSLLQMKVLSIECSEELSLATAVIRSQSGSGVVINNQLITETRQVCYQWRDIDEVEVVGDSLQLEGFKGALLQSSRVACYTDSQIVIGSDCFQYDHFLKVGLEIVYVQDETIKTLSGFQVNLKNMLSSTNFKFIQVGKTSVLVQQVTADNESPSKLEIPLEEPNNISIYAQSANKKISQSLSGYIDTDESKKDRTMKVVQENLRFQNSVLLTPGKDSQFVNKDGSVPSEIASLFNYISITTGNASLTNQKFRPDNLPPQSEEEALRVQLMVERDRKEYLKKKKEKQIEAEKRIVEEQKRAEKIAGTVKIWVGEIFPNWDNVKRSKRVREMWIDGLPDVIRGRVWFMAFGNRSAITRELFDIMAERGSTLKNLLKQHSAMEHQIIESGGQVPKQHIMKFEKSEAPETLVQKLMKLRKKLSMLISLKSESKTRERSILIIDTDIPRTFSNVPNFQSPETTDSLQRILQAFTMYRPDIGYVQGMSYVAAMLLMYMKDPFMSFVTFCNLMTKYPILPFYNFNDILIRKIMQLYKQVFAYNLPELCEHFELEGIQPKQYIYEWFMTLFTRVFKDVRVVTKVWDFYFLDGIFVLFQTAIAILRILMEQDLLWGEMEDIIIVLQNCGQQLNKKIGTDEQIETLLVKYMYDVSFPKWVYDEIPLLESEFFKQDLTFD